MNRNELQSEIADQVKKLNWLRQNPELQPIHLGELLSELKNLNQTLENPQETPESPR